MHRFVPAVIHNELGLQVAVQPIGWPWIEASYPDKTVQQTAFGALHATAGSATGRNGWNNIYVDWFLSIRTAR